MNTAMHTNTAPHAKPLAFLALVAFFGMTGIVFGALNDVGVRVPTAAAPAAVSAALATPDVHATYDFTNLSLVGQSAHVYDIGARESLFAYGANAQLPLASIAKVIIAVLADEHLDLDGTTTITASSLEPEGDSGFVVGEVWYTRDLLDFMIMTSSNDGSAALAEHIERTTGTPIEELMNAQARAIGMRQSYFGNTTGLDVNEFFSGAYGSARDVSRLLAHAYTRDPELLATTAIGSYTFTTPSGKVYLAENTNDTTGSLPGLVFGKTGFTDLAGGNLAVVIEPEPGRAVAIVVLGSTREARFADVRALAERVMRLW